MALTYTALKAVVCAWQQTLLSSCQAQGDRCRSGRQEASTEMAVGEAAPFGRLLRSYRRTLGLTQEELAERAGLSERAIRKIEAGTKHAPHKETVQLLADALELSGEEREAFQTAARRRGSAPTDAGSPAQANESVPSACPKCGEQTSAGARFCPRCGTGLGPDTEAREERKVVSVLIVELVGFTPRSDKPDPEDIRDLLRMCHRHLKERIEPFGGTMEEFTGDAVRVVFGAPISHTDDPERAVRAGLTALEAIEELNRRQPGLDLAARAAVSTGEALVTIGSGDERGRALAFGDVVTIAAGLQTSAPAGQLVVGDETYRATSNLMGYEALPPMVVKGKSEPLAVWRAIGAEAAPGERRVPATPMVGRGQELSLLESLWRRATTERRPHLVTIVGPPGIGKSRLSREFAGLAKRVGGRVIRGRCLPYGTRDVYCAFAQQVKEVADVFEQDSPETVRAKLATATAALVPEAERLDLTRSLSLLLGLGLDPPVDDGLLLLFSARRLVESLGTQQPTLLVFEDVHWADAAQLDLIAYLARHTRDTPVMLLALARPELFDRRPEWGSGGHGQSTITLDPLLDDDASVLVRYLLEGEQAVHAARRLIDVAEGNPLFLEELASALMEGADLSDGLPTTVRGAIAGRLDVLPPAHRDVLLAASVVGRVFWLGTLRALGQTENVEQILDDLETKELVRRGATSRVRGDVEFSFKHILIHDVCYATLPRARRQSAHASVGRYIEQVVGADDRDLAWLLAHHWEAAGEHGRAIDYLLRAADRAREAMAGSDALGLFERAYGLATDEPTRTRIRLLQALARVSLGDHDRAARELEALLPQLAGRDLLEAQLGLARSYHWTERTAEALQVSKRALQTAEGLGAMEFIGPAMARLSQAHAMRGEDGDLDRALTLGERALRVWVPNTRSDDLADHMHLLADQHYWTGRYERSLELAREVRQHAVYPSSTEALLRGSGMEGLLLAVMGRYEEAFSSFDAVIALCRGLGGSTSVLLNYSTLAFREIYDLSEARRRSEESLSQQDRSGKFHMPWMNALVDLIHCDVLAGETGAAETRWRELWDDVIATPAWERWFLGGKMAALRAEIALQQEDPAAAAEWAEKAIEMARTVHRVKYEAVARAALGKALLAMGRGQDAVRELQTAVRVADALGNPSGRWRAKGDLAQALVVSGNDAEAETPLREASAIIRSVATGLSSERAARFLAAPPIASIVKAFE